MTKAQTERQEAIERLRGWVSPGDTVYTILDHVSASGMSRRIRVLLAKTDDEGKVYFLHPNHAAAKALGMRQAPMDKGDGLIVKGCGMDMGFHVVYELAHVLFGDGYKLKQQWL